MVHTTTERSAVARNTDNFYKIVGDSDNWADYFTAEEYEEMTNVAERLRAPMDHQIVFENRGGKLYCGSSVKGDDLLTISRDAEAAARRVTQTNPTWAVEAWRRNIETREIIQATDLPLGAQMLVFSPTPDDVLSGAVNIGGYNLTKKTTMVRIWTHDENGLSCRYISLDGGNRAALTAAARAVGRDIPAEYNSEEILATFYTFSEQQEDLAERVIDGYDEEMKRQTGRDHSYGRPGLNHKKALDIAIENPARLHEHMATIRALNWRYSGDQLEKKLEEARYDYAAALDQTTQGRAVVSNTAAGGIARAGGADFSGYCAVTPNTNNSISTREAYNSMFNRGKVTGKCPCCGETTTYDPCAPVCGECGSTPGHNRSREYLAKKKEAEIAKSKPTTPDNKRTKIQKLGAKTLDIDLDNIKTFIWGAGAFDGVEKAVFYDGQEVVGKEARELYDIKNGLKKAA